MTDIKQFEIPLIGLKTGLHHFEYQINDSFFEEFKYSLIKKGNIHVDLMFDKQETCFLFEFNIKGTVYTACDRCLECFDLPFSGQFNLIIKTDDIPTNTQEEEVFNDNKHYEIRFIPQTSSHINIAQDIYEYINLSLPLKKVHFEKKCNKETIKLLNSFSPENAIKEVDSRWKELVNIK